MYKRVHFWVENYLFSPSPLQKSLSLLFIPFTLLYCLISISKRIFSRKRVFDIPIISIGNLIVGGSGKTPVTIALAKKYQESAVVLRGYKRQSSGLMVVSERGDIKCDVSVSGDEAMEYALSLPHSSVIVSEDRIKGIEKAKELGAKVIFLDDAFSKFHIKKFDILLKPREKMPSRFCLPSGPYREAPSLYQRANLVLTEDIDFRRVVAYEKINPSQTIFITAISKPKRVEKYLPKELKKIYFPDHHHFNKEEIESILKEHQAQYILTTMKDFVKIREFDFRTKVITLEIEFADEALESVDEYINLLQINKSFAKIA